MSQYGGGGAKNPPWVRSGQATMGMSVAQQGHLQTEIMGQTMVLQYPQAQMFQQQLGQMQQTGMTIPALGTAMNSSQGAIQAIQPTLTTQPIYPAAVTYPSRALNSAAFGTAATQQTNSISANPSSQSNNVANSGVTPKQRVFTGTVTKVQDNFGFVDEDVFFQTSCCVKGSNPKVGDRVLVEAVYNANMPFKWNATRIQVLPMGRNELVSSSGGRFSSGGYNSVPPPSENSSGGGNFGRRDRMQQKRSRRDDDEIERKKRREDQQRRSENTREREDKGKELSKEKERAKSPVVRKRSKSPRRPRRARVVPRYMVQIPKIALDMPEADVLEIRRRYNNLYIPSDFFLSSFRWVDVFPPHRGLTLERPCAFHVMNKDIDPVIENTACLDAPDADYMFSAKVMLLSMPDIDELFRKCCTLAEDRDKEGSSGDDHGRDFVHPTRLINFLVGLRGKNETMAIGGPWSPSLDGPNPEKDPGVLIKTAIRNCKALTGIDLSHCTQWYRFVEIYYRRSESMHKGKQVAARIETVVLYLPDVWNCLPTRLEWDGLHLNYKKQLERKLSKGDADEDVEADEKEGDPGEIAKKEPTHFSELDPKTMKVTELREELEARSLSPRGLKSQLAARLSKAIKTESDKAEEENAKKEAKALAKSDKEEKEDEKKKKEEEEKKKLDDRDRGLLEKRYTLPENTHILVHPSRTAKSGKFDCTVMSLSLLLDYRQEDTKEHSFEVSLFAELFNEMLMRDFGFRIYKALSAAPEKPKEEKEEKDRKKDKDRKSDKDRKDDKKDDKKDKEKKSDEDDEDDAEDDFDEDDEDSKDKKDGKGKKESDKKKKERVKLITEDPHLLLAFVYFDQTHCGYIFDKDIEELLFTLGLNLSRAQVKKMVQKVVIRDSLHYRKLTDKPKDTTGSDSASKQQKGDKTEEDFIKLGLGNKQFLPIFNTSLETSPSPSKRTRKSVDKTDASTPLASGFVMYNGSLLDVCKLMTQLKRSEDARIDTEKYLAKLLSENVHLKEQSHKSSNTIKDLTSELKDFKERLSNTNSELCSIDVKTKMYFNILQDIHDKVSPIIIAIKEEKMDEDHAIETIEMEDVQIINVSLKKETEVLKKESGGKKNSHTREDTPAKKEKSHSIVTEKKDETKQSEAKYERSETKLEKSSETKPEKSETKHEINVASTPDIEEIMQEKTENEKKVEDIEVQIKVEDCVIEQSIEKNKDGQNNSDENKDKECKTENIDGKK